MGVIKRIENLFEITHTVSEETLYIPSNEDEEISHAQFDNEIRSHQHLQSFRQRPTTVGPTFSNLKIHSGKKKFRRYNNVNQLITLAEEDELQEVTINDFIMNSKSSFAILMEDAKSLQMWDEFVSSNEEHQKELLENVTKRKQNSSQPAINRALRHLLRKKCFPLETLRYLEEELILFFSAGPSKTYTSPALSSFERLLLHCVSNYHHLASFSFMCVPGNKKLVRVKNPRNEFPTPPLLLVQYIKSNYGIH